MPSLQCQVEAVHMGQCLGNTDMRVISGIKQPDTSPSTNLSKRMRVGEHSIQTSQCTKTLNSQEPFRSAPLPNKMLLRKGLTKQYVFSLDLNTESVSESQTLIGKLFHICAAV